MNSNYLCNLKAVTIVTLTLISRECPLSDSIASTVRSVTNCVLYHLSLQIRQFKVNCLPYLAALLIRLRPRN